MSTFWKSLRGHLTSRAGVTRVVRYAKNRPGKALRNLARILSSRWPGKHFASKVEYESYIAEIEKSPLLSQMDEQLAARFANVRGQTSRGNSYTPGAMIRNQAVNIYALIRSRHPDNVVETGVCNGFSTAVFLAALHRNGKGHLHSVDLPEFTDTPDLEKNFWAGKGGAVVPAGNQSGWLVQAELRGRWTLLLGKSQDKLPPLLAQLGKIDLFIHDSEHSFENQMFEFRLGFHHLNDDGYLVASDINWSPAFETFWKEVRSQAARAFIDHSLAVVTRR